MELESVRSIDFQGKLSTALTAVGSDRLEVFVRLLGESKDSNVVFNLAGRPYVWRVGVHGGRIRWNTWNIITTIQKIAPWPTDGPVQDACEEAINERLPGWLRLVIQRGMTVEATRVDQP